MLSATLTLYNLKDAKKLKYAKKIFTNKCSSRYHFGINPLPSTPKKLVSLLDETAMNIVFTKTII